MAATAALLSPKTWLSPLAEDAAVGEAPKRPELVPCAAADALAEELPTAREAFPLPSFDGPVDLRAEVHAFERRLIHRALELSGGHRRRAATLLGLPLRTFERRLEALRDGGDVLP